MEQIQCNKISVPKSLFIKTVILISLNDIITNIQKLKM